MVFLSRWHFWRQSFPFLGMNLLFPVCSMLLISYSQCLRLEFKGFFIVSVNSHAAVVWDRPWHGSHSCDDAGCRVVTKNGIRSVSIFSPPTKNVNFTITHRHATIFLFSKIWTNTKIFIKHKTLKVIARIKVCLWNKSHVRRFYYSFANPDFFPWCWTCLIFSVNIHLYTLCTCWLPVAKLSRCLLWVNFVFILPRSKTLSICRYDEIGLTVEGVAAQ